MKQISCTDLGCCDAVISAPDDAQLKQKLFDHAKTEHPDAYKAMTPEMVSAVEQKIQRYTRTV
jgi:predicted small metal-binding protein